MSKEHDALRKLTRRALFKEMGYGIGGLALANLLLENASAQTKKYQDPLVPKKPHFAPKAKNIIYLFMAGAPSQVDLFDPKPMLVKHNGEPCPEDIIKGERFAFIRGVPKLLGSPHKFEQVGKSGQW